VRKKIRPLLVLLVSLLAGAGAPAAAAGATTLPIVIEAPARPAAAALTVTVHSQDQITVRTVLDAGKSEAVLELRGKAPWRVRAEGEGLWGEEKEVLSPTGAPLHLRLWETSGIYGELRFPKGAARPPHVTAELLPRLEGPGSQRGLLRVPCPLEPEKPFSCPLPAGRWHIRVVVAGMVPHQIPGVLLPPGKPLDVGQLELVWGIAVTGRVADLASEEQPIGTRVRLYRSDEGVLPAGRESALEGMLVGETTLDGSGTFRFEGVAPGAYWLSAHYPSCPPILASLFVSGEDPQWEIPDSLVFTCRARITVRVNPPEAVPDKGLLLSVVRENPLAEGDVLASGTLLPGDSWLSPPLAPGGYRIELRDHQDDQRSVAARSVSVGTEDLDVEFSLARVAIDGRLLLGSKPTSGVIRLARADLGARTEAFTDSDGRFSVILPAAGRWTAEVELRHPHQFFARREVEISPGRELEMKLPNGRVSGRVVNPDGTPVAHAVVEIFAEHQPAGTTFSAQDGSFFFRGLGGGRYTLTGEKDDRRSRMYELALSDGGEARVTVVLAEGAVLRCRVSSAFGPVANANVLVFPISSSGSLTAHYIPAGTTDAKGRVTFSLAAEAVAVRVYVMAAGFPFRATGPLPFPAAGESLEITLSSSQGGTLVLAQGWGGKHGTVQILMVDDAPVDVTMLPTWSVVHGRPPVDWDGALEVPMMPPGHYQLCRLTPSEAVLVMGGLAKPTSAACVPGHLAPGKRLVLAFADLPAKR